MINQYVVAALIGVAIVAALLWACTPAPRRRAFIANQMDPIVNSLFWTIVWLALGVSATLYIAATIGGIIYTLVRLS